VLIKFLVPLLKANQAQLSKILSRYLLDRDEEIQRQSEIQPLFTNEQQTENQSEVLAEDPEDFVYEAVEEKHNNKNELNTKNGEIQEWDSLKKKLEDILSHIFYDALIGSPKAWDDFNMSNEIAKIIEILYINDNLGFMEYIPYFIFLLRDQMISFPVYIPRLLPECLTMLGISVNKGEYVWEDMKFKHGSKTLLNVLSALANYYNKNRRNIPSEFKMTLEKLIPFVSSRLSQITASSVKTLLSPDKMDELDSIAYIIKFILSNMPIKASDLILKSGLLRDLTQIFMKFTCVMEISECNEALLQCAGTFAALKGYISQVPQFLEFIQSDIFKTRFLTLSISWFVILGNSNETDEITLQYSKLARLHIEELIEKLMMTADNIALKQLAKVLSYLAQIQNNYSTGKSFLVKNTPLLALLVTVQQKFKQQPEIKEEASDKQEEHFKAILIRIQDSLKKLLEDSSKRD